ncbi:MAG: hypothetical protein NC221_05755 [Duncaniella sp.]|nr:hypothetical protein [Muribaculum sp.]MCM1255604.1 hypothetical protein [Duncaniella sp.]
MENPFIISKRVINTIKSLSAADREPICNAMSMEFILGQNPQSTLTPMQNVIYSIIRFYVNQDTIRTNQAMKIS